MTEFSFTPATLRWIRRHCKVMNEADMSSHLQCTPGTLKSICIAHGVTLCAESDKHAELAPLPFGDRAAVTTVPAQRPAAKVHPRLNPALRSHALTEPLTIRPGRQAIAIIDREAARRRTTPAVLAAVILDIVATDNMFGAVLDLEE